MYLVVVTFCLRTKVPRHSTGGLYVCTSARAHGRKCAHMEIKERANEISICVDDDAIQLFYEHSSNPASDLEAAESVIMDPVEADQNRRRSLRNKRARVRRPENGEQARRQTRNTSLRSRRQQECAEQL